jgi:hypothetical protein
MEGEGVIERGRSDGGGGRGSDGGGGKGGARASLLTVGARHSGVGGCCRLCALAIRWCSLLFMEVVGAGHCSWTLGCCLWAPSRRMWAVGLVLGAGHCSWAVGSHLWHWDLFTCGARLWVGGCCLWALGFRLWAWWCCVVWSLLVRSDGTWYTHWLMI